MKEAISETVEDETAVVFIDDTDFVIEGEECQQKMQTILDTYITLFQAIGGAVNLQKTNYFAWQWKQRNSKLPIYNVDIELKINDIKLNQINCNKVIRTLGVHISPMIIWDYQFEVMADKMKIVMAKLQHIKIYYQ